MDFNKLSSLIQLLKEENELLNESKVDEIINDLRGKKEKDLLMIYKFEESIKHKYDMIIGSYENLKNQINELKNKINKSFKDFKLNFEKNNFEPNSLFQAIEESFNKTNKLNFEFFPFFKNYQEPHNSFFCKLFNFKEFLYLNTIPKYFISDSFYYHFHEYSVIVFPFGITGKESKLALGIKFNSDLKRKYEIKVTL